MRSYRGCCDQRKGTVSAEAVRQLGQDASERPGVAKSEQAVRLADDVLTVS